MEKGTVPFRLARDRWKERERKKNERGRNWNGKDGSLADWQNGNGNERSLNQADERNGLYPERGRAGDNGRMTGPERERGENG